MDFFADAACKDADPDLFFPPDKDYRAARAVCWSCTVKHECLLYARAHRIEYGFWGGLDPAERKRLRVHG